MAAQHETVLTGPSAFTESLILPCGSEIVADLNDEGLRTTVASLHEQASTTTLAVSRTQVKTLQAVLGSVPQIQSSTGRT